VDGKGTLCMFEEEAVEALDAVDAATYHTLRSVHNNRWYLGTGSSSSSSKDHRQSSPRRHQKDNQNFAAARRLVRPPSDFCGAHFSSGRHGPPPPSKAFYGVFDLVSDYMDGAKKKGGGGSSHRVNIKKTIAAKSSDISSSSSSSSSTGNSESSTLLSSLSQDDRSQWRQSGETSRESEENSLGAVPDTADNNKISKAHLEALRMQHQLTSQRHRIRHAKHKRPRPSREEKAARKQHMAAQSAESDNSA
jgi:hypothetical protein